MVMMRDGVCVYVCVGVCLLLPAPNEHGVPFSHVCMLGYLSTSVAPLLRAYACGSYGAFVTSAVVLPYLIEQLSGESLFFDFVLYLVSQCHDTHHVSNKKNIWHRMCNDVLIAIAAF